MSTAAIRTIFSSAPATHFWFILHVGTYVFQSEHESGQFLPPRALSCRHSWLSHFNSVTHRDICSLKITYPTLCNLTKTPRSFYGETTAPDHVAESRIMGAWRSFWVFLNCSFKCKRLRNQKADCYFKFTFNDKLSKERSQLDKASTLNCVCKI